MPAQLPSLVAGTKTRDMNKEPRFRILERWGEVHIQQQNSFLGICWWSTLKMYYSEGRGQNMNYSSVDAAKAAIDRALAVYRKQNMPEVITYYPS